MGRRGVPNMDLFKGVSTGEWHKMRNAGGEKDLFDLGVTENSTESFILILTTAPSKEGTSFL